MEFIPSPRGNKPLILWDCLNWLKAKSCNAKVKTLNALQERLHNHTHPADPEKVEVMKVRGARSKRETF